MFNVKKLLCSFQISTSKTKVINSQHPLGFKFADFFLSIQQRKVFNILVT